MTDVRDHSRRSRFGRLADGALVMPTTLALLCIGAYASQLFLGRWQTDEYRLFTSERLWGWGMLPPRLTYSPRPFSEILLFLYGKAVIAFDRPLITSFLATLWAAILGTSFAAAFYALQPSRARPLVAACLVSALFAFVLVTTNVTEAFYWPMAAAAYLPTAGSAVVLLFLLACPSSMAQRIGCLCALLVAASSSEMGAALAAGFATAALIEAAIDPSSTRLRRRWWWIVPGLLGVGVFAMIFSVRNGMSELGASSRSATGHPWIDFTLALRQFATDIIDAGSDQGTLVIKLIFAFGFASVWRQAGGTQNRSHALLFVAIAVAIFFSLFAAYFHYGTVCCERQATTRQWLIDLLLILLAATLLHSRLLPLSSEGWRAMLPPLLLVASLTPVLHRISGLRSDFDVHKLAVAARTRTWASGLDKDHSVMKFYLPPDGANMLVRGTFEPTGTFKTAGASEMTAAVGAFFAKTAVTVCQPWQTEKSWLLNGQFIPACPPHPGPPDIVYNSPR